MKISRLLAPLLFVVFFSVPLLASAGTKAIGEGCFASTDCASNFCDGATETCQAATGSTLSSGSATTQLKAIGQGCFASTECASGFCDGATETCKTTGAINSSGGGTTALPGNTGAGPNQPSGTALPTSGGGGINLSIIKPYSDSIITVINGILVPVLMAIAFIVFLWGVYKYFILGADSETERETGRTFVIYGVIGFAIIISIWGLVYVVITTFVPSGVNTHPNYPTL